MNRTKHFTAASPSLIPTASLIFLIALLFTGTAVRAATYTWTQNAAGSYMWNDSGNWSGGTTPPSGGATDATVQFFASTDSFASGFALTSTNDLAAGSPSDFDLNSLVLNGKQSSGAPSYTVNGDTLNFVGNGTVQPTITVPNNGGSGFLTIDVDPAISLASVDTLTINSKQGYYGPIIKSGGNISGSGDIAITGGSWGTSSSRIELNGNKTFTGDLTLGAADSNYTNRVTLGGSNSFTGNVTVNERAALRLNGTDAGWSGSTTVNSGGILTFTIGGGYNWSNDIVNNGNLYLYGGSGAPSTVSGNISGSGNVYLSGNSASMNLTGASTFTGKVIIASYGWTIFDSIGNVDPDGTGPATALGRPNSVANGTIDFNWNQHVTYTGTGHSSDRNLNATTSGRNPWLRANGTGALVLSGDFTVSTNSDMTFLLDGTNTDENAFQGSILNRSGYHTSVSKQGVGLWVLGGNNTVADYYTGTTTVSDGTLRASAGIGGSLGTGNLYLTPYYNAAVILESRTDIVRPGGSGTGQMRIQYMQGGTARAGFSARGADITVAFGSLASPEALTWGSAPFAPYSALILNATTADSTLDFRNNINLNGATRNFYVGAATAILSGDLSNGGVTKTGTGTLTLSGNNSYSGNTTVTAGKLVAGHANAFGTSGTVTVNSGTKLAVGEGVGFSRPVMWNTSSAIGGSGTYQRSTAWTVPATFTVAPGLSTGTLTLDVGDGNAVTLLSSTTLDFEFASASDYDKLVVTNNGTLDLAGSTLNLSYLDDFNPAYMDTFQVITANMILNDISGLTGDYAEMFTWETTGGTLTLTSLIPEPASGLLLLFGGLIALRRRGRRQ